MSSFQNIFTFWRRKSVNIISNLFTLARLLEGFILKTLNLSINENPSKIVFSTISYSFKYVKENMSLFELITDGNL